MIVLKTNLKKIPENCNKCSYYVPESRKLQFHILAHCRITQQEIKRKYIPEKRNWCIIKPDNCPLIKIEI